MGGILIQYEYSGDEKKWEDIIRGFINNINRDERLRGKFSYIVNRAKEGSQRVHLARWNTEETLDYLRTQPFFKEFTQNVKGLAGETLQTMDLRPFVETSALDRG
jgi:hypothetical protein